MSMQQYCLRWNNHQPNFISVFSSLLNSESLVDVTLSAEGRHLQAHKLVLSACSSYFQSLFTINPCQHPIVILKDVKFLDLKVIIDFMYYGEVNVSQDQLPHILKTAEMLKIKGLAEIPVEASVNKQNNTSERADLLTPVDPNWSSAENQQRQSLSPTPCPLSPSSKRKRLRKSSTGSGSGSTERTLEEHPPNEVTLTSPLGTAIIKPDPGGFSSDNNTPIRKQLSSESEMVRTASHESVDSDSPHQITLQIPQQEMSVQHGVETSASMDMAGPSSTTTQTVTDRVIISTHAQYSQSQLAASTLVLGPKRGRLLMRQSRIKREIDIAHEGVFPGHDSGGDPLSLHTLTVPHMKVERQVSDPLPTLSPPAGSLLTVPGSNILVKQHSHPLLPSRTPYQSHSPPPSISSLQIHRLPQSQQEADQDQDDPPPATFRSRSDETSATTTTTASSLRVRTEELKRSASSPTQTNTRSSHCPLVRPGPALGCNYCWNTVDTHGRILRRKTKYYCPECQTNLCIVPCFQEYHEQTDPVSVKTAIMRIFPKTGSM